jgi:hypothetical protein
MAKIETLIETLRDRMPQSKADRIKIFAAVPVIALCVCWITYLAISSMSWSGPTRLPDTPGYHIAMDMTKQLNAELRFNDVGVSVATEKPLKLKVEGAVHSQEDLTALEAFLKEIRPEQDYEVDVLILR